MRKKLIVKGAMLYLGTPTYPCKTVCRLSGVKFAVGDMNHLIASLATSDPNPHPDPPFSPPLNYEGTEDDFADSMVDRTLGRVVKECTFETFTLMSYVWFQKMR